MSHNNGSVRVKETYVTYGQKTTKKMWQGKTDDDTQRAFADETEGKKRIPEDTFEDPDITLKAFRDMPNGEERPSSPENLEGPLRISLGKDPPDYGPSGGLERIRMKGLCGRSYTTRSSWIKPLWS